MLSTRILLIISLLLAYPLISIGQTISLKNKKETKTVVLESARIVEIEINNRIWYRGQTVNMSDSTLSMQTKIRLNRKSRDTLVTVPLSAITEIVYCTRKDLTKCEPEKRLYIPIIVFSGLIFELIVINSDWNQNLTFISIGGYIAAETIHLFTGPKRYNVGLRWKIAP